MKSLKMTVADSADPTPYGYGDGVDAGGEKHVPLKRLEGANLAKGKPYTISRAPSGFQSSAGASNTTILTDGVVGSPVTGSQYYWWGQCWASGSIVDLQVDLGSARSVGAFRAHMFGYPFWDALKGQVQDRVEILTSVDGVTFISQGFLQTSLWRKDIPVNYMLQDDETATGWNFEQTSMAPVQARYVRYHITPKRSMCVSELQVFDRIDYQPFDLRIALPGTAEPPPPENVPPSVAVASPSGGAQYQAPASVVVTADAQDADGTVTRVEFLAGSTIVGAAASSPFTTTWANAPAGMYVLKARATDNSGATTTSDGVAITVAPAAPENQPPQVVLTSPVPYTGFSAPAMVSLVANATDADDGVAQVEFFAGSLSLGVSTSPPYQVTWSNMEPGQYSLTAVARDASSVSTASAAVIIVVVAAPPPGDAAASCHADQSSRRGELRCASGRVAGRERH